MEILFEDKEFAHYALTEGCIAVPIDIFYDVDSDQYTATVYEEFADIAYEFNAKYGNDPFSDDACEFLRAAVSPAVQSYGLTPSPDDDLVIRMYTASSVDTLYTQYDRNGIILIQDMASLESYKNLTTHELEIDDDDPDDVCAVCIDNTCICAYATVNDYADNCDEIEISVECAPAYRNRGLATACTCVLTEYLISRGYRVSYQCRKSNQASVCVAEKSGFLHTGTRFSYVCYRNL